MEGVLDLTRVLAAEASNRSVRDNQWLHPLKRLPLRMDTSLLHSETIPSGQSLANTWIGRIQKVFTSSDLGNYSSTNNPRFGSFAKVWISA